MSPVKFTLVPKEARISDDLTVQRVLPRRERRMIGPFCFLDHMGHYHPSPDHSSDVLAHPHIGLSTLTRWKLFSDARSIDCSINTGQIYQPESFRKRVVDVVMQLTMSSL